ncbi:NUDIX domain-containing protein [Saccharopolyspora gloriosae]|uniref:NUDIX hydrolase n=1 Tax=Saccharopolyspora gloriosae TaxID=455344 RepID=UPI002867FBC8|nr:NUDIX domain-containing protein [Saccharopolyspora gloriosae]
MIIPNGPVIRCVGGVVHDAGGRTLLVRRANDPGKGRCPLPGGRVEAGETDRSAVHRELLEETGLSVIVEEWIGRVPRPASAGTHDIHGYACRINDLVLFPGDDASQAMRADTATFDTLAAEHRLTDVLAGALRAWADSRIPFRRSETGRYDTPNNRRDSDDSRELSRVPGTGNHPFRRVSSHPAPPPSTRGTASIVNRWPVRTNSPQREAGRRR